MKTKIVTMLLVLGLISGFVHAVPIALVGDLTGGGTVISLPMAPAGDFYFVPAGLNIFVPAGATFTIEPGVYIEFQNGSSLQTNANSRLTILENCEFEMMTDSRFVILGDFFIEGTPTRRVYFHKDPLSVPGWDGIIFNACIADTVIINYALIIEAEKINPPMTFIERSGSICVSNSAFDVFQVNHSELRHNIAGDFGGAIAIENSTCTNDFKINHTIMNENTANMKGGAIYSKNSRVIVSHCEIILNYAAQTGGGIHAINPSMFIIEFSALKENNAIFEGGGAKFEYAVMVNPTLDIHHNTFYLNTSTRGGGLFVKNGGGNNLVMNVMNNLFDKNSVTGKGGGIFMADMVNSTYHVETNEFIENTAAREGGAIYIKSNLTANFQILKNIFERNDARYGGGIFLKNALWGLVQAYENKFFKNEADVDGGACYITGDVSAIEIVKNSFDENAALTRDGGAIMFNSFDHINPVIMLQNQFGFNTARDGGAVCSKNEIGNQKKYLNNLFYHNNATNNGGAIYCGSGYNFLNNTIAENNAGFAGGIYVTTNVVGTDGIINDILWANTPNQVSAFLSAVGAYPAFFYCDIDDAACTNPSDIIVDPLFVDPGVYDYHLQSSSPCIETGDPGFVPAAYCGFWSEDLDWTARIKATYIDMGAYENDDPAKSTLAVTEIEENNTMMLYPSPALSYVNVRINLNTASQIYTELVDLNGRIVKDFETRWLVSGNNEFVLDVNDISHGFYFVRISGNNFTNVQKIMIR